MPPAAWETRPRPSAGTARCSLSLIAIELLSRRVPVLLGIAVRARLVGAAAVGYLALVGLVTLQALRGQSVVAPDAVTLGLGAAIVVALTGSVLVIVARAGARARARAGVPARDRAARDGDEAGRGTGAPPPEARAPVRRPFGLPGRRRPTGRAPGWARVRRTARRSAQ